MSAFPILTKIACPKCGRPVEQHNTNTQTIICAACGSYIAVGGGTPELITGGRKLRAPGVPIEIGSTARIEGVDFFVMGRVQYTGWDENDKDDTWTWNEWLLGGSDGRLLWLSHDEHGLTLYRKIRLTAPFAPRTARMIPIGNKSVRVHERYPAKIDGAEGELTWRARPGEQVYMVEAAGNGKRYSIQATASELEVHEGVAISELDLARQFGDEAWIRRIQARARNKALASTIGAICLVFAVFALIAGIALDGTGEVILQQRVQMPAVEESELVVPVELDQVNRPAVISLSLVGGLPVNSAFDVDVSIRSPNEVETFLFLNEYWHETGRDEDGPWTETSYQVSNMFVPTVAGLHALVITLEDTVPTGRQTVEFDLEVRRNHITPLWYIVYAIGVSIAGGIAFFIAFRLSKS